jgi:hypothetical protein
MPPLRIFSMLAVTKGSFMNVWSRTNQYKIQLRSEFYTLLTHLMKITCGYSFWSLAVW